MNTDEQKSFIKACIAKIRLDEMRNGFLTEEDKKSLLNLGDHLERLKDPDPNMRRMPPSRKIAKEISYKSLSTYDKFRIGLDAMPEISLLVGGCQQ
jgi:hypothetical protein